MPRDTDALCTFKVNALIDCLTALLESINLILVVGHLFTHPQNYIVPTCINKWDIPHYPSPIYRYSYINARALLHKIYY